MSETLEQRVMDVLRQVTFPGMSRDVVSFGFVRGVEVDGARVVVDLRVPTANPGAAERIREEVDKSLQGIEGCDALEVRLEVVQPQRPEQAQQKAIARDPRLLEGVGAIIAVASGKGGVG
jgi:ATP-binding protein involved in chromosome partitioning